VTAALLSLHDLGLSFNDLKPENILVTEIGHVKIADFGACRGVTLRLELGLELRLELGLETISLDSLKSDPYPNSNSNPKPDPKR
jgi:serine/threonine protein kinase